MRPHERVLHPYPPLAKYAAAVLLDVTLLGQPPQLGLQSPDLRRQRGIGLACLRRLALLTHPSVQRVDADPRPERDIAHRLALVDHLLGRFYLELICEPCRS